MVNFNSQEASRNGYISTVGGAKKEKEKKEIKKKVPLSLVQDSDTFYMKLQYESLFFLVLFLLCSGRKNPENPLGRSPARVGFNR